MKRVTKNFIYNLLYQLLVLVIPLITTPYLTRILGSSELGKYSYHYSIAYYFVIFIKLGLDNYGNRSVAEVREDKEKMSKTTVNIYSFQFLSGIVVMIIYVIYAVLFSKESIIALIFGFYVLSAVFDINWFFYGLEEFKLTVIRNFIVKLISTVLIFVFVKDANDIKSYCMIMSLSFFISQLSVWPYAFKRILWVKPCFSEIRKHIAPNLYLFITVLAVSLFKVMDKIMLGLISDYDQVGFYEVSEKVISIPIMFITALGTVMLPYMTNKFAHSSTDLSNILEISISFAMFISCSLSFGIMGVSREFVPLFYGENYTECINIFLSLLPSCLFLAFANVIRTQYLLPNKMDKDYIISAFIGATINIISNILLIPKLQAVGAGIGTLLAEGGVCIYQCWACRKYIPLNLLLIKTLPMFISGITMFFVLFNMDLSSYFNTIVLQLLMKILVGSGIFILLSSFFFFAFKNKIYKSEWEKLFQMKRGRKI